MLLLKEAAEADSPELAEAESRLSKGTLWLLATAITAQVCHIGVHLLSTLPVFYSDLLQGTVAAVSAAICFYKSRQEIQYSRRWIQLTIAFFIWSVAQFYYSFAARSGQTEVALSDLLWLLYAFPILLVTLHTPQTSRRDTADFFDATQACIFFCILFALFFPIPGIISQAIADDVQGVALLLALILRYCITAPGRDRIFFRNLTIYMAVYLVFCVVYYAAVNHGFATGSIAELCWSIPFTFFSVLVLCTDLSRERKEEEQTPTGTVAPSSYIQGLSALGLAIMSMAGSALLAYHKPLIGGVALAVTFALFAARTIAREWQLNALHARLKHSVLHDPLTSVANRTLLQAEISRRLTRPASTAALFVGLDRFKTLNDCLGHAFGDLLLKRVSELLSSRIRKQDLVARYGGDEFVILLDSADARDAAAFAERILDMLRTPLYLEGRVLYLTASIGLRTRAENADPAVMLQDAHFAMHHAKKSGRDRVATFEAEMVRIPRYKLSLENDLRESLAADEMTVFYQPIFAVDGGEVRGFEALARWTHKERGVVSPADFIPVAEDTGMILELGAQIMRKACQQCADWNRQFGMSYTMNVNVSAHQFANPDILAQVLSILHQTGLEPRFLKLEITESVLLTGHAAVEETLINAQKLGIQICLDDFGTGYSSLSYLLNYPIDVVKIDQSFVRHLDHDPRKASVVRVLVDLALSLNKQLVAEGVERPEEIAALREFGCELMQGYLPSRPLSAEKATEFLERHDTSHKGREALAS